MAALLAVRSADDPSSSLAAAREMVGEGRVFDGMIEVSSETHDVRPLAEALARQLDRLGDLVDRDLSAATGGVEHTIVEGTEPMVHVFALRRLPAMEQPAFHHHWISVHAEMGHRIPGIGAYRQFHVDSGDSRVAADALALGLADYDGVAETFCRDLEAFNQIMTSATVAAEGISDQREFIDQARSTAVLCDVVSRT